MKEEKKGKQQICIRGVRNRKILLTLKVAFQLFSQNQETLNN